MIVKEVFDVATEGSGREDYSLAVELTPIPVISGYQEVAYFNHLIENVPAGGSVTYESEEFDYTHFIFDMYVSATANVHIRLNFYVYSFIDKEWKLIAMPSGYQSIHQRLGASFPASKIKLEIFNDGDVDVNIYYSHFGVKGIEKISPWVTTGVIS